MEKRWMVFPDLIHDICVDTGLSDNIATRAAHIFNKLVLIIDIICLSVNKT